MKSRKQKDGGQENACDSIWISEGKTLDGFIGVSSVANNTGHGKGRKGTQGEFQQAIPIKLTTQEHETNWIPKWDWSQTLSKKEIWEIYILV